MKITVDKDALIDSLGSEIESLKFEIRELKQDLMNIFSLERDGKGDFAYMLKAEGVPLIEKIMNEIYGVDLFRLNNEVKIIEEDKKIEKLDIVQEKNCKNNWKWKIKSIEHDYNISTPQKIMGDKINEIIDYINKEVRR